jgi:hypothetical protein
MSKVCVLAPDHAEALEERGRIPDCRYHGHLSHLEADAAVALEFDHKNGHTIEGWGQARTVRSIDGRRRITPIPQILGYASRPSIGPQLFRGLRSGYVGPHTQQAIVAELH